MTNQELIDRLKECPPDNKAVIWVFDNLRGYQTKEIICVYSEKGSDTILSEVIID